jgi:feruloyl esterase
MNGGWMDRPQIKQVHDAVLAQCDSIDGLADGIVADPVGCRQRLNLGSLQCTGAAAENCLTAPQLQAARTLMAPLRLPFELANGLVEYPGRGPSGEDLPAGGPTGGWRAWWTGSAAPTVPPVPANGIGWFYGAGAIQYFYARNPRLDVRQYRAEDHAARIREVSAMMDSTNPDLSAFHARGGKILLLEHMADYAQSPYAGIQYIESVQRRMGAATVERFFQLYTAPNVDHVGTGAPALVDMLAALAGWVERGQAPANLVIAEQDAKPPFAIQRERPLCPWPLVPRYQGGDANRAASFRCTA